MNNYGFTVFTCGFVVAAHAGHVQGVAVDGLNQVTITAGRDGEIKFWHFKRKHLLDSVKLDCCIDKILLHRER